MNVRRLAAGAVVVLLVAGGCGGDDGGDDVATTSTTATTKAPVDAAGLPAAIADALVVDLNVPADRAACVADKLIERGFSDDALQAMADSNKVFPLEEAPAFAEALQQGVTGCSSALQGQIAAALQKGFDLNETRAACVAAKLVEGEFSSEALDAMADDTKEFPAAEAAAFSTALRENMLLCAGELRGRIAGTLASSFGIPLESAECVADRLLAGGFSQAALEAMADESKTFPEAEADEFAQALQTGLGRC